MAKGFFNGEYVNGIPVVDSALSDTSVRPVQNKVVKGAIDTINDSLTKFQRIETGSVVTTIPADAMKTDTVRISFSKPFKQVPNVIVCGESGTITDQNVPVPVIVPTASTEYFEIIVWRKNTTGTLTLANPTIRWVAIGF